MALISSGCKTTAAAEAFSVAWAASRAPQSTHVMPGCENVQAMTNWPMLA